MSKFKVIERSRFLNEDTMQDILGGGITTITICSTASTYRLCSGRVDFVTCGISVAPTYTVEYCPGGGIGGTWTTCSMYRSLCSGGGGSYNQFCPPTVSTPYQG